MQARPPGSAAPSKPFPWLRLVGLAALGAAIGVAVMTWGGGSNQETDLLARLGDASADFRPQLVTVDATAAERFVLDAFGWPVAAPTLPDLQLVGVGESTVIQTPDLDVSMPAFRYDARDGQSLVVFVYDYVLLDGVQGALDLPEPIYARLAEESPVDSRRQQGLSFVTWRVRSVVYTAVTEDEDIAEGIARGVSS